MKEFTKITEQSSNHDGLEHRSTRELLEGMNQEDKKVAEALERAFAVAPRKNKLLLAALHLRAGYVSLRRGNRQQANYPHFDNIPLHQRRRLPKQKAIQPCLPSIRHPLRKGE